MITLSLHVSLKDTNNIPLLVEQLEKAMVYWIAKRTASPKDRSVILESVPYTIEIKDTMISGSVGVKDGKVVQTKSVKKNEPVKKEFAEPFTLVKDSGENAHWHEIEGISITRMSGAGWLDGMLYVYFKSKSGIVSKYVYETDQMLCCEMIRSNSIGTYFHQNIRPLPTRKVL
jgi:squalene cyclase